MRGRAGECAQPSVPKSNEVKERPQECSRQSRERRETETETERGERAAQLNELRKTGTDPLCSVASFVGEVE